MNEIVAVKTLNRESIANFLEKREASRLDLLSKNTPVASVILALFIPLTVTWIFGADIQKSTDLVQKITVAAILTTDAFEKSKKAHYKKTQINKMRENHK